MKDIKIKINQKELNNYQKYKKNLQDFPIYASTGALFRSDIVILQSVYSHMGEIATNKLAEGEYIEITIKKVKEKDKRTNTDIDFSSHLVSYFETLE